MTPVVRTSTFAPHIATCVDSRVLRFWIFFAPFMLLALSWVTAAQAGAF